MLFQPGAGSAASIGDAEPDSIDPYRSAAGYVDCILKDLTGTRLPIERLVKYYGRDLHRSRAYAVSGGQTLGLGASKCNQSPLIFCGSSMAIH